MGILLSKIVSVLEEIAPAELAEEWDNVGLLLEPPRRRQVARVFLTIDLTEPVLDEAIASRADLIVAYHPPIFTPLARLCLDDVGQRVVLRCLDARIAVYSPHTALDAAGGGVNDWLADGLGAGERCAIESRSRATEAEDAADGVGGAIGQGRHVSLAKPLSLDTVVRRIKKHLGLSRVRVAKAAEHVAGGKISSVALCAGAGGSVITSVTADLYWTGEMRHHDVLAARASGRSVVLCEHTNTERGYLDELALRLAGMLRRGVSISVSRVDREPLDIV